MVIEWLKIKVPPELREAYIQKDEEIWTTALAKFPGFVGKEVWINPQEPSEVVLVIRWTSREAWKAIPTDSLQETEKRFAAAMPGDYPFLEQGEYQVRKFPQTPM